MTDLSRVYGLLAYPSKEDRVIQARLKELKLLGISCLNEGGNDYIQGIPIIGKGYCGVILRANWKNAVGHESQVALKVRRFDAPHDSFEKEALNLQCANTQDVGPLIYAYSQNFIAMELLSGLTIYDWLHSEASRSRIIPAIHDLLWQCFRLDQVGLDHGNLRCITEHVIMHNRRPVLIDFSSSSRDRRPSNVTTLIQGLFWSTVIPSLLQRHLQLPQRADLLPLLRKYKQSPTRARFLDILSGIELDVDCEYDGR